MFFVKGRAHRAISNILIASKQTSIRDIDDRHNAKLHTPLLKPARDQVCSAQTVLDRRTRQAVKVIGSSD